MKNKVIIDADCGIDDALALIYAIKANIDIIGITSVSGNVNSLESAKNIKAVLNLLNTEIDIYTSDINNLSGELIDAKDTHGLDGLGETFYGREYDIKSEVKAEDFILDSLDKYDDITIIAMGPLTNLARAYRKKPDTFNKCKEIISMGGVFRAQGNMTPVSEFNYYHDPLAVEVVLKSDVELTIVGLDVTRKVFLTPDIISSFKDKSEVGKFISEITKFYVEFHKEAEDFDGCIINDILTIDYYLDRSVCTGIKAPIRVVTDGYLRGQILVDEMKMFYKEDKDCMVLTHVNGEDVIKRFLDTVI